MSDYWYFLEVNHDRQLSLHEVLCQDSKKHAGDALEIWTPINEKVQVLKTRKAKRTRNESRSYAVPLYGGTLMVRMPTEAAEKRLQRFIEYNKDVYDLMRDPLKPGVPIAVMSEEQRAITESDLVAVRKEARRKGSFDRKYKNIKPEGFDYKQDSKKNRQKKYDQAELIYPEFEIGEEVTILSGPFVGFKMTVDGKMKDDDSIPLEGFIFDGPQKVKINVFALQKAS